MLAVDLDPQASLTALHGYQPEYDVGPNETMYAAIRYDDNRRPMSEVIKPSYIPGLDLVPGNLELMEYEHDTPRALAERSAEPFFGRVASALGAVSDNHDIMVLDCPPQLGFLTLGALCASTGLLITAHPQMLDVMSMCQFLLMASDLLGVVQDAGGDLDYDFIRYVVTRYEPSDAPQTQMVGFMRSLFRERVLTNAMLKSAAISDAGLSKQPLYEVGRENFSKNTYDRAIESLDAVNGEIESLIRQAWIQMDDCPKINPPGHDATLGWAIAEAGPLMPIGSVSNCFCSGDRGHCVTRVHTAIKLQAARCRSH